MTWTPQSAVRRRLQGHIFSEGETQPFAEGLLSVRQRLTVLAKAISHDSGLGALSQKM